MKRAMFRHCVARIVMMPFVLIGAMGCSGKSGQKLFPVRGRITLDGQPLARGSISLRVDPPGSAWQQPTGIVEKPGEYSVYSNGHLGAPAGTYRVVVFATDSLTDGDGKAHPGLPQSLIPLRYNQPEESPLRLRVSEAPLPAAYDLELKSHEE